MNNIYQATIERIRERKPRSAWDKGVQGYALELAEQLDTNAPWYENNGEPIPPDELEKVMLNGAKDWSAYSWGGCSECYDCAIAKRLCTPSELKRTRNGERKPNNHEEWIDTQARALYQAARIIYREYRELYAMRGGIKP